jgi:hypothetical protein
MLTDTSRWSQTPAWPMRQASDLSTSRMAVRLTGPTNTPERLEKSSGRTARHRHAWTPVDVHGPVWTVQRRRRPPVVKQLVKEGHHSTEFRSVQGSLHNRSGLRFRRSKPFLELVGDTGIEPVTSSVSGINSVLSTPPPSTKPVPGRPLMSTGIRGRCQAFSQVAQPAHTGGRPWTNGPR